MMQAPSFLLALAMFAFQPPGAAPPPDNFKPDPSWKQLGENIWFDKDNRRLAVRARVVLREGPLEHLLCLKGTKEHEAILATSAAPRQIQAGLLLTGAEVGRPVQFAPKFQPPTGSPIEITLEWQDAGKTRKADARDWVLDEHTKKPLNRDWVFAGSMFIRDPVSKQEYFAADDGDLITVANFASAILDLPFASTANDADHLFVPFTERIPPRWTGVTMFFRPRPKPADAAKPGGKS
jgi:hypothetical protein